MSDVTRFNVQRRAAPVTMEDPQPRLQRRASTHDASAQLRQNAAFMAQMRVQRKARGGGEEDTQATLAAAAKGVRGRGGALPYLETIQKSFGHHDVTRVQAFVGGQAKTASEAIGAEAYASGNAVAFRESPTLHTAAHEAAHIVQQRYGVQLQGGVGQVGDKYEMHADAVADRVVQGKDASDLLDGFVGRSGPQGGVQRAAVQRKRRWSVARRRSTRPVLGVCIVQSEFGARRISVEARTVLGWKRFLASRASSVDGMVQLNAFMARALGHSHFAGIDGTNLKGVARPGQTMAEKLMEALLTSGGSINLADKSHEQPGREFEALQAIAMLSSDLLAAFNARYAATTLTHMTERQVRLRQAPEGAAGLRRSTYPDAVGAYAEEAADMQDDAEEASGRKRADPNQTLVAAAMGTAMGGALRVHWAGKDPARNREANLGFQLVRNGAMTVKGCIDQLKRDELTTRGTIMSVFSKAMGVAGNLSAVATPAARGLATVGLNFLSRCLAGEAEDGRTELIDRFDGALQAMVQAQGLIALHKEQLLDCFSSEVR